MIDLTPLKSVRVAPYVQRAWAEPGVLRGEFDQESHAFRLATTGGIVSHAGVAGLTLGGEIGWLSRKYGTTADNLMAADVVTAEGRLVRAGGHDDAELLWGLRGGGDLMRKALKKSKEKAFSYGEGNSAERGWNIIMKKATVFVLGIICLLAIGIPVTARAGEAITDGSF